MPAIQVLTKLVIRVFPGGIASALPAFPAGGLEVPFNPNELTTEKNVQYADVAIPGLNSEVLQWVRGEARRLTFELFFDLTDEMIDGLAISDVQSAFVAPLELLLLEDPVLHRPPSISVQWGPNLLIPRGVVRSLSVTYNLFDVLGRPVRATARLTVQEDVAAEQQLLEIGATSPDLDGTIVVRAGDTLPLIAFRAYGNATEWRTIATANRLSSPLALIPGTTLLLPRTV